MSYSCSDFTDSILDALAVELTDDENDRPDLQADKALAAIEKLRPRWAVAYYTNSHSPRARRWYRISRVVYADHRWFELYWHPDTTLRSNDRVAIRKAAVAAGLQPLAGLFTGKSGGGAGELTQK